MRLLRKVWDRLAVTCDRALQLGSEAIERDIGGAARVRLAAHTLSCKTCRAEIRRIAYKTRLRSAMQPRPGLRRAAAGPRPWGGLPDGGPGDVA